MIGQKLQLTQEINKQLQQMTELKSQLMSYVLNSVNEMAKLHANHILKVVDRMQQEIVHFVPKNQFL